MLWADLADISQRCRVRCPGAPRCGCPEEGTGRDVGLQTGKRHVHERPMTKTAHGSGSGSASAQVLMVAGGRFLFCELICLFLSLVHDSLSVLWPCPKPLWAAVGCVAVGFPSVLLWWPPANEAIAFTFFMLHSWSSGGCSLLFSELRE